MRFFSLEYLGIIAAIAVAGVCWGAYGPVLHRGQLGMEQKPPAALRLRGHRLLRHRHRRAGAHLSLYGENGSWVNENAGGLHKYTGILWSLGGGTAARSGRWA